jgi:uncharacterized protein YutE (UPF0331/DUF86 family)
MSKIDMIIEDLKVAPPEVVDQVFALMQQRGVIKPEDDQGIMRHFGALRDSDAFKGDPVEIQRAKRRE